MPRSTHFSRAARTAALAGALCVAAGAAWAQGVPAGGVSGLQTQSFSDSAGCAFFNCFSSAPAPGTYTTTKSMGSATTRASAGVVPQVTSRVSVVTQDKQTQSPGFFTGYPVVSASASEDFAFTYGVDPRQGPAAVTLTVTAIQSTPVPGVDSFLSTVLSVYHVRKVGAQSTTVLDFTTSTSGSYTLNMMPGEVYVASMSTTADLFSGVNTALFKQPLGTTVTSTADLRVAFSTPSVGKLYLASAAVNLPAGWDAPVSAVPEPTGMLLVAVALAGFAWPTHAQRLRKAQTRV